MAWLAVDEHGYEWVFQKRPIRLNTGYFEKFGSWYGGISVELPKGTIKKLIGEQITYESSPIKLKEENIEG